MISMPESLPGDPVLLEQPLEQMINERASDKGKIVHLEEEVALLRQRLFGRRTEQTTDSSTPQLPLFDEAESLAEPINESSEEEGVAPGKRRGKRKPLPDNLPRVEIIHARLRVSAGDCGQARSDDRKKSMASPNVLAMLLITK